jgi:microcompartment protein CcmK/EutM
MKLARIKGHVTSTVKHSSLEGHRLLIAQPVTADGSNDGAPQIVLDPLGAAIHQLVLINSDGGGAREMVKDSKSPARWSIMGIIDHERLGS